MPRTDPHPVDAHIGQRLKRRRKELGISRATVAQTVGVTYQQIHKYEAAQDRISASRLWELSMILDVPVAFFYDGIDVTRPVKH